MGKNSDDWFTTISIFIVAFACYIVVFYPEASPKNAIAGALIAASIVTLIAYILDG